MENRDRFSRTGLQNLTMEDQRPASVRQNLFAILFCILTVSACGERNVDSNQTHAVRPITNADEREIVSAVLEHLSNRSDSPLGKPNGVILVKSKTDAWTRESLSYYSSDPKSDCPITLSQYDHFAERNPAQLDARELVDETAAWKFASEDDEKDSFLVGKKHSSGREIRTLLSVSTPAGDAAGALVIFHFTWSIHGGLARYIVEQKNNHWEVKCSRIDIYL